MIELTIGLIVVAIVLALIFGRRTRQKRERAAEAARRAVEQQFETKER